MRALLQQLHTGLYWKAPGQWTPDPADAHDFISSVSARTFCMERDILDVQIVLKFGHEKYDIVLPAYYSPPLPDGTRNAGASPEM